MGIQDTLKALADPIRREILNLLKNGRLSAGEICEHFSVTGASISRHLAILKEADLIRNKREGKFIYYELNTSVLEDVMLWIIDLKGVSDDEGNDKKILVDINYPIHKQFTPENKVLTSAVAKIMRITFVEEIREKISGVYGISVSPCFSKYEKGYLNIFFSTDPKKEKMVLDKLHFEINKILHGYINLKALDSIKENYKLSYENNLKMSQLRLEYLTFFLNDDDY